jgi:DNA-binding NarL/FixJ family response regulator
MTTTAETNLGLKAELPPTNPDPTAPARSLVRVWLTDDNARIRCALHELLARTGEFICERQFASAEALLGALATERHPDVVLLDIEMGGMSGVAALRPIRQLARSVRVLIMTAFFDPIYETQALRGGASAFMVKSYALTRMVEEIHQALERPIPSVAGEPELPRPAAILSEPSTEPAAAGNFFSRATVWLIGLATALRLKAVPRQTPVPGLALNHR